MSAGNQTITLTGQEVLDVTEDTLPLWLDYVVIIVFATVFRLAGYIVLRTIRHPKKSMSRGPVVRAAKKK